ncbi:MAG: hypothetical protein ACI8W8_004564 [Rhodothermales bacterium]|jgi:hypothetical protein
MNPNLIVIAIFCALAASAADTATLKARSSALDPEAKPHPHIDFVFEKDGKILDWQHGSAPTAEPRGQLVIWMMSYNAELFKRLNSYGLHSIQPHYANRWFSKICRETPVDENCRGNVRLEAATGLDFSLDLDLAPADGMVRRAYRFVSWLAKEQPEANWAQFLDTNAQTLHWDRVIMSGSSHGSTTSARFAKHQRVARVVALCGPRDQYQAWQRLESATPAERYFGFSHVLDGGWTGNHYCRSWQMLGLHQFGPIVNVDNAKPPYGNTRRLISAVDVKGNAGRAHSAVTPGKGKPDYEDVWRYLYTHPVDQVGDPVATDPDCVVK